uniref:Uncharacterized protein n=1 Tax=Oryza meridionalis TaxID=40149 RepID=A0A0E0DMQ0_9ORYZ
MASPQIKSNQINRSNGALDSRNARADTDARARWRRRHLLLMEEVWLRLRREWAARRGAGVRGHWKPRVEREREGDGDQAVSLSASPAPRAGSL